MSASRLNDSPDVRDQEEPGVVSALGRAIESAQGIVANRIDLAKLDVLDGMSDLVRVGGMLVYGSLLLAIGWAGLMVAAVVVLEQWTSSLPLGASLVGGISFLAGGAIVRAASRHRPVAPAGATGRGR